MAEEINGLPLVVDQINTVQPGAFVAGSFVDGADPTLGTTLDAPWGGSGSGSGIAILKAIFNKGGGGAVTEADGANVTLGAKADAAWGGSGSGSLIAVAKALYVSLTGPTPAGTNVIGGITAADGAQVSIGAKADAAVSNPANAASLIALTKGVLTLLGSVLSVKTTAGAVVSGSFASGALADGADVAQGTSTDAPLTAVAGTGSASTVSILKGVLNSLLNGTARMTNAVWFSEGVNQTVAASAALTGTNRGNANGGAGGPFAYFSARLQASQAGTLTISNGAFTDSVNVTAGSLTTLKVPATGGGFTATYNNTSANSATATLLTMFSAA